MEYTNFAIELTAQTDGKYCIEVQSSPVGEATVTVPSPFTVEEIEAALALFGRVKEGTTNQEENQAARQFGQRLFQFLIRDHQDINAAYFASLDRVGAEGLRIRLSVERAGLLAELPWELLYDPAREFVALSRQTPVVRYTQQLDLRPPVEAALPLRVLVMISAPENFPTLDVEGEWQRLNTATKPLQDRGMIQLERLDTATLTALQHTLRTRDFHVFHYIGHSDYDSFNQEGLLVLEAEDGKTAQLVSGAALAREIGEESTIRLVLLNSCQSARRAQRDPFSGLASSIVARGIPAVVAMQFPITDRAANVFSEEFYRALADLLPIDTAVSEARRAISNRVGNAEWATPVLFMRSDDGVVFQPPRPLAAEKPRSVYRVAGVAALVFMTAVFVVGALAAALRPVDDLVLTPIAVTPTRDPALGEPNLAVVGIRSSPSRPAPGQVFRLLISIRNTGRVDTGAFNWVWDASPTRLEALEGRIDNIAPGATQNISFPYSYGWWGSYSSLITLDIDNEVAEIDERDNRDATVLELNETSPFIIDFSLLPDNAIVTPPQTIDSQAFFDWNMIWGPAIGAADCLEGDFEIIEVGFGLGLARTTTPESCVAQPLSVNLRRSVSNAEIEITPEQDGTAIATFYGDLNGEEVLFTTGEVIVTGGVPISFSLPEGQNAIVRRVDVSLTDQRVQVTQLVLFPII